jgi:metallo-beta-lactamase family protein
MHLVRAGEHFILLDCGRARGHETVLPCPAPDISAIVISHAHVDHCGYLPALMREGFNGPIICTPATRDLLEPVLADSARFQEGRAWVHRIVSGQKDGELFGYADVSRALQMCRPEPYGMPFEIVSGVTGSFADAGHILGSAMVHLQMMNGQAGPALTFTGDLGRPGMPILRAPQPIPEADLIICESTYGGRRHEPVAQTMQRLADVVRRTIDRGGKVLIPSFSLGRMQLVTYALLELIRSRVVPDIPLYVDSPLAGEFVNIHLRHRMCLNDSAQTEIQQDSGFLSGPSVHYLKTREESVAASERPQPCVVVASGGMCDGGRILHYLKRHLDDPRCTVVLISYQAPGTVGRQLIEPRPTVRFHGRKWNFWAEVVELNGFSGHADHDELLTALKPLSGRASRLCLVHGEPEAAQKLAEPLAQILNAEVCIPHRGEEMEVRRN